MERVVITAMGAITPIGNDVDTFWNNALAGQNGIAPITLIDPTNFKVKLAAEVKDFDAASYMDKRESKKMNRFSHFALASAKEAMAASGLTEGSFDPYRAGVIYASGIGGLSVLEDEFEKLLTKGPSRVSPFCIPSMIINMAAAHISMTYGLKGISYSPVTACASSTNAIGEAFRQIKHGYLDIAVCGGSEACITRIGLAGFMNMHAVNTTEDVNRASIPFDKERSGFVMGEGGGTLVLESLSHAQKRGATILAEVVGYGSTSDAYHITSPAPDGQGAAMAMKLAMEEAGIDYVDYINAHGTSTPLNDKYETLAVKVALGEGAKNVSISSTKSMTGHMLGAAGAVEAIACAMAVMHDVIPPTINFKEADEDCDLDYTVNVKKEKTVRYAMSNSLGFGGHNASIILAKVD